MIVKLDRWGFPEPTEQSNAFSKLTHDYFAFELEQRLKGQLQWDKWRKLAELRKSCGVESKGITIRVGLPARYKEQL